MTNDQMKPNRFARWAAARRKHRAIIDALNSGAMITLTTYTRQTRLTKKHVDMVRPFKNGVFIQRGKNWDCIDGCQIDVWR